MTTLSTGPSAGPSAALPAFNEAFPRSAKVYLEGSRGVRVPVREIALSGGEPPLQVYDTSGPQGFDVRRGVPPLRRPWILSRDVEEVPSAVARDSLIPETLARPVYRGRTPVTQLHYARLGEITPEMEFVALREGV